MSDSRLRLALYGGAHFMVDFACLYTLFSGAASARGAVLCILVYNALAFGLQAFLGSLCDRLSDLRAVTALGMGLVAWGVFFAPAPIVAVALAGLGNALFHVSGAVACLRSRPGDAAAAGVYVAPGALGVALGIISGTAGSFSPVFVVFLLLAFMLMICGAKKRESNAAVRPTRPHLPERLGTLAVMVCLVSIGVRSFGGFAADSPEGVTILGAGVAAFLGKFLGGFIARRVPWRVIGLVAVGIGGLMMALLSDSFLFCAGLFLFNLAMPLTLAAVMGSMPSKPGLAFGLTTLALLLGWLPAAFAPAGYAASAALIEAVSVAAALMLFFALKSRPPKPTPAPAFPVQLARTDAELPVQAPCDAISKVESEGQADASEKSNEGDNQ